MASILQAIFSLPAFQERYGDGNIAHAHECTERLPADCLECQIRKVADGLLSGRYSVPAKLSLAPFESAPGSEEPVFQAGLRPTSFKALVGKGHAEFATMRQQDSEEFLTWLITVLRRDEHKHKRGKGGLLISFVDIPSFNFHARCDGNLQLWDGTASTM